MKKKVFAIVVALTMMLALALPIGAGASGTYTITINAPTSLSLEGQSFAAYKIFDLDHGGTEGTYAYTIAKDFEEFASYPGASDTFSLADYLRTISSNSAAINELAGRLHAFAIANDIDAADSVEEATEAQADQVVLTVTEPGYYMVFGSGFYTDDDGEDHVIAAVMLTSTDPNADITLKADEPKNEKTSTPASGGSANIGDFIDYTLNYTVPNRAGYVIYVFNVTDVMTEGLTFQDDIKVTVDGAEKEEDTDYTLHNVTDRGFELRFVWNAFREYRTGAPIVITYSAMINQDAAVRVDPETNKAVLEYSNKPDGSTTKTPEEETEVFTYDFEFLKVEYDNDVDKNIIDVLGGAVFTLHDDATPRKLIQFVVEEAGSATEKAIYRVATTDTLNQGEELVGTITTPDSGKVYVKGLAAGDYFLTETVPPLGYVLPPNPVTLVPVVEGTAVVELDVPNYPAGTVFPETGGSGTTMLYVAGALILVGGVVLMVIRRRIAVK